MNKYDVLENVTKIFIETLENGNTPDLNEIINEESNVIYYNRAFEMLKDLQVTEFTAAFEMGYTDIEGIASYYLNEWLYENVDFSSHEEYEKLFNEIEDLKTEIGNTENEEEKKELYGNMLDLRDEMENIF